jgi:hypothetical protein
MPHDMQAYLSSRRRLEAKPCSKLQQLKPPSTWDGASAPAPAPWQQVAYSASIRQNQVLRHSIATYTFGMSRAVSLSQLPGNAVLKPLSAGRRQKLY